MDRLQAQSTALGQQEVALGVPKLERMAKQRLMTDRIKIQNYKR